MSSADARRAELEQGLDAVRQRITTALDQAGRADDPITLIVVTKFFPASDVRLLADLGVADVGENRHQEAVAKAEDCADLGLRWHYIGGLQSNKAGAVARYAHAVHSVDRAKLLGPLGRGAAERADDDDTHPVDPLDVLLQVSLDPPGADNRSGVAPGELAALAQRAVETDGVALRGLMAVAPLGEEPSAAFDRLREIRAGFLADHPEATWLSAGMSGDLEQAIAAGATHVRVGSAVLGSRPVLK